MKFPNGTAAVCAENISNAKANHWNLREGEMFARNLLKGVSQKTYGKRSRSLACLKGERHPKRMNLTVAFHDSATVFFSITS